MHSTYRRMLRVMQEKENALKRKKKRRKKGEENNKPWLLYILQCNDGSFYTGITNNIDRRFQMHMSGRASHYTRTRRPVELLYREPCTTRTQAMVRECAVKALSRRKKEELVALFRS